MAKDQFTPQVDPSHYRGARYDVKERFISYHRQIELVIGEDPNNVLEVGIGNGFVHRYLRQLGVSVHTVDADSRLAPDTAASVLALPFEAASFDVVCCFETLEHLPWGDFVPALRELARVASRSVLVSLPDVTPYLAVSVDRGKDKPRFVRFRELPSFRAPAHVFDGEHYWEIGKRGYPLARVSREIARAGLRIHEISRSHDHPYHRYFRLRRV